jgi:hypothetical protein
MVRYRNVIQHDFSMYEAAVGAPKRPIPAPPQMVTTKDQLNSSGRRVTTESML